MNASAQTIAPDRFLNHALEMSGAERSEDPVRDLVKRALAPDTITIDRKGKFPAAFMHQLGELGGYRQHLSSPASRGIGSFSAAVRSMATVSEECMSTGLCQDALAWYLDNADNPEARSLLLPGISDGTQLGGTGLSNAMKHFASIEKLKVSVRKVKGGYMANGTLPWVSNLGPGHAFASIFRREDDDGLVMAVIQCDQPGFRLQQCAEFTALEGSGTYACHFNNSFIPDNHVISARVPQLIRRIRSGFVLLQMGMGLGLAQGCLQIIRDMELTHHHVNRYLDDQPDILEEALTDAWQATEALAEDIRDPSDSLFADVLQLRYRGSELALKASQAAMLHAGARGYLADAPAQRKLRESYFVAIVTPAMKHIRKELDRLGAL